MSALPPIRAFDANPPPGRTGGAPPSASILTSLQSKPHAPEPMGFQSGTRLATPMGYVAVERLAAGDMVLTADGSHARLRWTGMHQVEARGVHAPVVFETGMLDNMRPLRMAQGHRVRLTGWRAELLFDSDAVLAAAKSFVNDADVSLQEGGLVTYCHLLFDRHEVVLAENIACETLIPGPAGLARLDATTRDQLLAASPGIATAIDEVEDAVTLPCLTAAELKLILAA